MARKFDLDTPDDELAKLSPPGRLRRRMQDEFLEALTRFGKIGKSHDACQQQRDNHSRWLREDPSYEPRYQAALDMYKESIYDKGRTAILDASSKDILNHPVLLLAYLRSMYPEFAQPDTVINNTTNVLTVADQDQIASLVWQQRELEAERQRALPAPSEPVV